MCLQVRATEQLCRSSLIVAGLVTKCASVDSTVDCPDATIADHSREPLSNSGNTSGSSQPFFSLTLLGPITVFALWRSQTRIHYLQCLSCNTADSLLTVVAFPGSVAELSDCTIICC